MPCPSLSAYSTTLTTQKSTPRAKAAPSHWRQRRTCPAAMAWDARAAKRPLVSSTNVLRPPATGSSSCWEASNTSRSPARSQANMPKKAAKTSISLKISTHISGLPGSAERGPHPGLGSELSRSASCSRISTLFISALGGDGGVLELGTHRRGGQFPAGPGEQRREQGGDEDQPAQQAHQAGDRILDVDRLGGGGVRQQAEGQGGQGGTAQHAHEARDHQGDEGAPGPGEAAQQGNGQAQGDQGAEHQQAGHPGAALDHPGHAAGQPAAAGIGAQRRRQGVAGGVTQQYQQQGGQGEQDEPPGQAGDGGGARCA